MLAVRNLVFCLIVGLSSGATAYGEEYVFCTHGLRKLDNGEIKAHTQTALFRISDLKLKTEQGWRYELACQPDLCDISMSNHSVIIHKKISEGHEVYLTTFDKPNMEIIVDRTRLTHTGKRTAYIEFQCDWFDPMSGD